MADHQQETDDEMAGSNAATPCHTFHHLPVLRFSTLNLDDRFKQIFYLLAMSDEMQSNQMGYKIHITMQNALSPGLVAMYPLSFGGRAPLGQHIVSCNVFPLLHQELLTEILCKLLRTVLIPQHSRLGSTV